MAEPTTPRRPGGKPAQRDDLLADWVRARSRWPVAWLSLDERVFLDEGAPMAALLRELLARRRRLRPATVAAPHDQLARLAETFARAGLPVRPPAGRGQRVAPEMVEPLTARELEVLRLLAAARSNQAIAGQLVVTLDTVKSHVSHILGKLGAANRTEAAARAQDLGLLGGSAG